MSGLQESDKERLQQMVHTATLLLNPCAAYELEVQHHA